MASTQANDRRHFLVMAVPPHRPFGMPGGPDAIVEVRAKKPVTFAMEPLTNHVRAFCAAPEIPTLRVTRSAPPSHRLFCADAML